MPPQPTRELRDLTRYRVSLVQEINRIANRIQKVLEDANIKLASVATDALGASGRAILEAMLAGEQDSARLADMSKGLLRNKIPELKLALEGRMTEHHRFLLHSSSSTCASRNRNGARSSRRSISACSLLRIRSLGYAPFPESIG